MLGKRIINTATGAAPSNCTTDTVQILGDTSCVAYYKMSDSTDETGSYDGTPTNVNFNVAGKFGNAGEFNGSSSGISITSAVTNTQDISVSLWIKDVIAPSSGYDIVYFGGGQDYFYITVDTSGEIAVYPDNYLDPIYPRYTTQLATTNSDITDGGWHHIVVLNKIDSSANGGGYKIYVDGFENASASFSSSIRRNPNNANSAAIGYNPTAANYLDGKIDQVRIFDKAITANEVTTLYNEVYCQPTIVPTDHFNTVIWDGEAGNGSRDFSGVGFQPDLVWAKRKSSVDDHHIYDSVRGAGSTKVLASNKTAAEPANNAATYGYLDAFLSDGFSTVSGSANNAFFNENNQSFVAWNWKAGGAAVTNTDGTITSQVSANVDAGFSVVKYSSGATATGTVGHGLNQPPQIVLQKSLGTDSWFFANNLVNGGTNYEYLILNTTGAQSTSWTFWDGVDAPNSTTFKNGWDGNREMINYAFHSVDGMSKIGSYDGTGANGNSIVTGFRPAFVMVKRTNVADNWAIVDNKRGLNGSLFADDSSQELNNSGAISFESNGFTVNGASGGWNNGTSTYIFMAFAKEVFVPDNFFNDDSTVATYKLNGDAVDDSVNGYNGTASNVTYATGKFDDAAVFNGSSSTIATPAKIPFSLNFSFSFWFNTTSSYTSGILFSTKENYQTNGYFISINNGKIQYGEGDGTNNATTQYSTTTNLNDGNWHHCVVTRAAGGTLSIYIDNIREVNNASLGTGYMTSDNWHNNLRIGRYSGVHPSGLYYDGKLDQVRIFDRALDEGEVTQLANE